MIHKIGPQPFTPDNYLSQPHPHRHASTTVLYTRQTAHVPPQNCLRRVFDHQDLPCGMCMMPTVRPAMISATRSVLMLYSLKMPRKGRNCRMKRPTHGHEHSHFLAFPWAQVRTLRSGRLPPSKP